MGANLASTKPPLASLLSRKVDGPQRRAVY